MDLVAQQSNRRLQGAAKCLQATKATIKAKISKSTS